MYRWDIRVTLDFQYFMFNFSNLTVYRESLFLHNTVILFRRFYEHILLNNVIVFYRVLGHPRHYNQE